MEDEAFEFSAAVVLFGELDAKLPALIEQRKNSWGLFWGPFTKRELENIDITML